MESFKKEILCTARGMTLIDVVVGTAIMLMVFLGLFGAFKLSIELVLSTKAKTGAVFLVGEKIEHIRLLAYDSVGTVGGIPSGSTPQVELVTLNGISYTIHTLIQYVDDPADGLGEVDENGIVADYKRIKVEALWNIKDSPRSTSVISDMAPVGVENLSGGGTLKVNVFDALAGPVPQADVHIVNTTLIPAVDVTAQTNDSGSISFPGALEGSGYEISVSKTGFSSAGTYTADAGNPNPSPGHVSIISGQTSTMSLSIDQLSSLLISTFEPIKDGSFSDTFADASQISSAVDTEVATGALQLVMGGDGFVPFGYAFSEAVAPPYLVAWDTITVSVDTPSNTSVSPRLYYWNGSAYVIVPDGDLPGNSTGSLVSPIDISSLATSTYYQLQLEADLESTATSSTPRLLDWSLSYQEGPLPLPDVNLSIHGDKTIGTDAESLPLYKYDENFSTDSLGVWNIDPLEWDAYAVTLPTASPYAVVERCPNVLAVSPNTVGALSLIVDTKTTNSLRVVVSVENAPVQGATVTVAGVGGGTKTTSSCGQAYFPGLSAATHSVSVNKTGYELYAEDVAVSGENTISIILVPSI